MTSLENFNHFFLHVPAAMTQVFVTRPLAPDMPGQTNLI